ncbi:tripartite tricarboxylate transporter TctB family protein [Bacillus mesophilum]|uniref:Tripartite tricarboxylate transporter TctB family protein n=1 Tax=Bacillus mesophilum TaxID=1071718 RepID=A0A7V7V1P0_9BACI|nr:tripartite tricarboxylate transporter TctB family protein [Bacillus mesophilum]KAB2335777.1 tripartite tricarboxylate transporter TctB family protein [Bacillus mesophilum]
MQNKKLIVPGGFIVSSIIFLVATLNLPKAKLGDPNGPLYFPGMIGLLLLFFSIIYLVSEVRNQGEKIEIKTLFTKKVIMMIVWTTVFSLIYTFIFEVAGFLISTTLFLYALLHLINGKKKWKINVIVAVVFTVVVWFGFESMGIILP